MQMTDYTIIIPHKNIPYLLVRCIDSIPQREDVQIIVVDDNSDIKEVNGVSLLTLPEKYPHIEFIWGKNENGRKGAGYARNLGLERAKGKWLIFADADDFFMPCFNEILDKYKNDENDIIYFYITSVDSDTLQPATRHQYIIDCMKKIQDTNDWDLACNLHAPVCKLIRSNIIKENNIFYSEVQWGNDVLFGVKTMRLANAKIISQEIMYCATSREASLTKQVSYNSLLVRFKEIYKAITFLKQNGRKQYLTYSLYEKWLKISHYSILRSLLLLPQLINAFGVRFFVFKIIKKCVGLKRSSKDKKIAMFSIPEQSQL